VAACLATVEECGRICFCLDVAPLHGSDRVSCR
jgi:hypothetical protein